MKKIKEKHVERLMKGQKSGVHLGSRQVPHHLYKHEKTQFEFAIKYGFLTLKQDSRVNLLNIWEKYCQALQKPMRVLKKFRDGTAEVWYDYKIETFKQSSMARKTILSQATSNEPPP
jgi:hypothetical protein